MELQLQNTFYGLLENDKNAAVAGTPKLVMFDLKKQTKKTVLTPLIDMCNMPERFTPYKTKRQQISVLCD